MKKTEIRRVVDVVYMFPGEFIRDAEPSLRHVLDREPQFSPLGALIGATATGLKAIGMNPDEATEIIHIGLTRVEEIALEGAGRKSRRTVNKIETGVRRRP